MKTPKRTPRQHEYYWTDNGELRATMQDQATRWKRKNKIKQLKRSLQRYKHGTMLPKLMAIRCAYKRLQELKKPSRKASSISWFDYLAELRTIEQDIIRAIVDAASYYGVALEREEQQ